MGLDMNFYKGKRVNIESLRTYNQHNGEIINIADEIYLELNAANKLIPADDLYLLACEKIDARERYEGDLIATRKIINDMEDIFYFRKHSDLHGYIAENYSDQADGEDNCSVLLLEREDIIAISELAQEALSDGVEQYSGFFWGESDDSDWERTLAMCEEIIEQLKDDEVVYYSAWY